ncbi:DUF3857 domain-containing protein [Ferruginibacter yonginensis]|uniref:DUF3857 domain-containing protein n=1 Tax=Ferruginibacter yonginensis TaxID=1310416 RepID=A0ABV8QSX5_9BACT
MKINWISKTFLAFVYICNTSTIKAQQYAVNLIPEMLQKNAFAVKRFEEIKVTIKSTSKAFIKHKYAVTILSEAGAKAAQYQNSYDRLQTLSNIDGALFDANGKKIKSIKKKDIGDFSERDEVSLITDNRVKLHNFYYNQYPYTVEYEDEQELNGLFFLPSWQPVEDEHYSVQQSNFIVEMPETFVLRFKIIANVSQPIQTTSSGKKTYSWSVNNLTAVVHELYQPSWAEINPAVYIAPSQFELQQLKGDMSSWLQLGNFINQLNNNRQQLPDDVKQEVHRLTDPLKTPQEKVAVLYNYLQKNTRYISVQLGIGGWQPFDATYVATKKYGDCKALSNYMISLLKEAGVTANYVLINGGDNNDRPVWDDFAAPYFNHAIMCVPMQNDTTWLECTSQTVSAGYMGSFTGNRKALLIAPDGGHLVKTPTYKANDNLQLRNITATIDATGNLSAKVVTKFTGLQQDDIQQMMYGATLEQKKKYLNAAISLPTYEVVSFDYKDEKGVLPAVTEQLTITAPNYATVSGKRLFVTPNFFNKSGSKFEEGVQRTYDIVFPSSYIDVDSIQITIPDYYEVEALPKNVQLQSAFGTYNIQFVVSNNQIKVIRRNERKEGRYPRSSYAEVVKYYNDIFKADRGRIVLTKK